MLKGQRNHHVIEHGVVVIRHKMHAKKATSRSAGGIWYKHLAGTLLIAGDVFELALSAFLVLRAILVVVTLLCFIAARFV